MNQHCTTPPDELSEQGTAGSLEVDSARVAYRIWGRSTDIAIILIHGGAAHARWWDHLAPVLAANAQVIAVDLAGHGESEHRESYSLDSWASHTIAAADHVGTPARPIVIGHSLGGWVAARVGAFVDVRGVVMIDSVFTTPERWATEIGRTHSKRAAPIFTTRGDGIARFRLSPDEAEIRPALRAHIAWHSLREITDGWTWKYDPRIFGLPVPSAELLAEVRGPVTLIRAEFGLTDESAVEQFERCAPPGSSVEHLPGAGHHALVDRPQALVELLTRQCRAWD